MCVLTQLSNNTDSKAVWHSPKLQPTTLSYTIQHRMYKSL